ncbi:hypothetical protein CVIRNUC_008380 [Coccomyxa viridis]|uniref:TauD/TfdA-like domain-containing protein n=1 Tax=Coccomyxa viridis TaxID=1274662 RepID=A0AAV1ICT8_9CHLO|nr:hypothetical protein CVIRNUC_008380 [Coccomyxa viridis]
MAPGLAADRGGVDLEQLTPSALIKKHYADAKADQARIAVSDAPLSEHIRHSGPQGKIEPFTIVDDPSAWVAADYRGNEDAFIYRLTKQDLKEVEAAVATVETKGLRIEGNLVHIQEAVPGRKDFPLPTLGPKLEQLREEVRIGRGFQLLRGFPVDTFTRLQTLIAYWGFGLHWGNVVPQNAKAHIVGHVKNIGHDVNAPLTRVYATPLAQPVHTDSADMVALLSLRLSKEGGLSSWSSSVSVHNELLRLGRKDLVEELVAPHWYVDRKGETPPGKKEFYKQPIFNYYQGFLSSPYTATYYTLAQRHPEVPLLTQKQHEALRMYNALALSDRLRLDLMLQPGDIQLLSNHTQLHTRSAFIDYPEIDRRRHLMRLWVAPPNERPLPDEYIELWGSTKPGHRGGIFIGGTPLTVPLEAE